MPIGARNWTLLWVRWIQYISSILIHVTPVSISFSHLGLCLPSSLCPSHFSPKFCRHFWSLRAFFVSDSSNIYGEMRFNSRKYEACRPDFKSVVNACCCDAREGGLRIGRDVRTVRNSPSRFVRQNNIRQRVHIMKFLIRQLCNCLRSRFTAPLLGPKIFSALCSQTLLIYVLPLGPFGIIYKS
jgi:hypothetical protein